MIEHLVLCRIKPNLSYQYVQTVLDGFINLRRIIDGIEEATYGLNITYQLSRLDFSRGYSHGIRLRFRDRVAALNYYNHPAYQTYYNTSLHPILDNILVVDFEVAPNFMPLSPPPGQFVPPPFPTPPNFYGLPGYNPPANQPPGFGNWPPPPPDKKPWE